MNNVQVKELRIDQADLTTKRMLDLMAVNSQDEMPLYLHSIIRILRELRIKHQSSGKSFHYGEFKKSINTLDLTSAQKGPLTHRLDTLESFMPINQRKTDTTTPVKKGGGIDWRINVIITPP